jgi:hypothetical protein
MHMGIWQRSVSIPHNETTTSRHKDTSHSGKIKPQVGKSRHRSYTVQGTPGATGRGRKDPYMQASEWVWYCQKLDFQTFAELWDN